mmetsp:Transcript_19793/g.41166  ORF Transcript_19793/g.41166 Transcript_19793/m.41166 type:complete len:80 (+) Transcript_19793:92-331(+)
MLQAECSHRFCAGCVSKHITFAGLGASVLCPNCRANIQTLVGEQQADGEIQVFSVRYKSIHFRGLRLGPAWVIHNHGYG